MERVTGIGGVFFRAQDPAALSAWYQEHLGVPVEEGGHAIFPESRNTVWSPFPAETDYWPREKGGMVNFTVDRPRRNAGAAACSRRGGRRPVEDHEYGRFGWFTDPEGNRVELWQPLSGQ